MYGAWIADVAIATVDTITSPATISIGGLSFVGTVIRQSVFAGTRKLRLVAGAGGWRKTLPPRGYSQPSGVRASAVIGDAARECGETVSIGADPKIGSFFTRDLGKAKRVLSLIVGAAWYVDNAGVTQVREREASAVASPFTVNGWDGGRGVFEISTETYQDWVPGRTFSTVTVPDPQTISSVTIEADNEGKVRLTVLTADSYRDRLLADFRAIVRDELASAPYACSWEYVITATDGTVASPSSTVDVTPEDSRMPSLIRVPIRPGIGGETVTPTIGSKCRVQFVNADPTRPECVGIVGVPVHLFLAGGSVVQGAARAGDPVAGGTAIGPITSLKVSIG